MARAERDPMMDEIVAAHEGHQTKLELRDKLIIQLHRRGVTAYRIVTDTGLTNSLVRGVIKRWEDDQARAEGIDVPTEWESRKAVSAMRASKTGGAKPAGNRVNMSELAEMAERERLENLRGGKTAHYSPLTDKQIRKADRAAARVEDISSELEAVGIEEPQSIEGWVMPTYEPPKEMTPEEFGAWDGDEDD